MSSAAVSTLAGHAIETHRLHQDPERLTIVPAVVIAPSEGPRDMEALALALGDVDGATVIAADNAPGAAGRLDNDLRQLVEVALEAHGRHDVRFEERNGGVVVSLEDGTTAATASEAQRELLGVLASLFDAQLHGSEIAALVYDESEFDRPTANLVWSLCTVHLRNVAWANLRTLLVVARAGRADPERHFTGTSARFVVDGEWVDERRSWEVNAIDVAKIAHDDAPLVLFLAAGFSASSKTDEDEGLAIGNDLRDRALRRLLGDTGSGEVLARRFHQYCKERKMLLPGEQHLTDAAFAAGLTLERVLVEELKDPPDDLGPTLSEFRKEVEQAHRRPGVAVEALGDLLARRDRRVVLLTVNLDDLVERHCADHVEPIVTDEQFATAAERIKAYWEHGGPSPLLKIHGTLDDPSTLVASIHSVALGLSDAKIAALDAALLRPERRTTVCYIGASMRDRDLTQLLGLRRYAERLDEWWIAPTISQSVREFIDTYRHRRWQVARDPGEAEAHCITMLADDFMRTLLQDHVNR